MFFAYHNDREVVEAYPKKGLSAQKPSHAGTMRTAAALPKL